MEACLGASRPAVKDFAKNQTRFFEAFKAAMVKMGRVGVKNGRHGEIRKVVMAAISQ
jgi:peroxidase